MGLKQPNRHDGLQDRKEAFHKLPITFHTAEIEDDDA